MADDTGAVDNNSNDDEMEETIMDFAEASNKGEDVNEAEKCSDSETLEVAEAEKCSDSVVETLEVAEASNNSPHIDEAALAPAGRVYLKKLFSELDIDDTAIPIDSVLNNLAEIRNLLLEKNYVSQHTNTCLETMEKIITTKSIRLYKSNDPDCFRGYYEDLQNLWKEIMNNMPKPFSLDRAPLKNSVAVFERRLTDYNVVGETILNQIPHVLLELQKDVDIER